jgi:putative FmdB family regulatory protein
MPIYEYLCKDCNEIFIENRSGDERDNVPPCKTCNNPTNRLYSSIGISFKGNGFYSTDK